MYARNKRNSTTTRRIRPSAPTENNRRLCKKEREMYLNKIANTLGVDRALAKIHLKKLEKAGIVTTEDEAKAFRYYELVLFDIHVSPQILKKEVEKSGQ